MSALPFEALAAFVEEKKRERGRVGTAPENDLTYRTGKRVGSGGWGVVRSVEQGETGGWRRKKKGGAAGVPVKSESCACCLVALIRLSVVMLLLLLLLFLLLSRGMSCTADCT